MGMDSVNTFECILLVCLSSVFEWGMESEKPLFFSIYSSFSFGLLAMRGNECAMLGIGDGCVLHAFLLARPCCDLDLIYYISERVRRLPISGKGGWMKSEFFLKQAS